jgi:hypothetical protein
MRFLVVVLMVLGFSVVAAPQPASPSVASEVNSDVKVQRQGILEFEFDPDEGAVFVQLLEADGGKRLAVDAVELEAIGDGAERGRSIRAELTRVDPSSFRGSLNLSEGMWNLIARVKRGEVVLLGQYALGVGKAVTAGRFALVPPNPEVNRLTTLFAWLFGVPVALAVVVTLAAIVLKPKRRREANA